MLPSHALGQDDFRTDEVGEVNHPDDASGDSALTIGLGALGLFGVILGSPAGSIGSALGQHRLDDGSMATLAVDAIFLVIAAGESLFADDGSS